MIDAATFAVSMHRAQIPIASTAALFATGAWSQGGDDDDTKIATTGCYRIDMVELILFILSAVLSLRGKAAVGGVRMRFTGLWLEVADGGAPPCGRRSWQIPCPCYPVNREK